MDITTNGKLNPARAKLFIASGGIDFDFQKPSETAPRWMKWVWQKVTQKQKLAKMATNKKKEAAWELAIPVEGVCSRRSKEPEWVAVKVVKESRSSVDLAIRGADRRHKNV